MYAVDGKRTLVYQIDPLESIPANSVKELF